MFIHYRTEADCRHELTQARAGRIVCARDRQPYLAPIYFACDADHCHAFSTIGQERAQNQGEDLR